MQMKTMLAKFRIPLINLKFLKVSLMDIITGMLI